MGRSIVFKCGLGGWLKRRTYRRSYIWNAAQNASAYTQLTFGMSQVINIIKGWTFTHIHAPCGFQPWLKGVFFQELAQNFQLFRSGGEAFKLRLYVGHDGSMIRLASGLGLGKVSPLQWPALGSEIAFEVRKSDRSTPTVFSEHGNNLSSPQLTRRFRD